jgi:hypothetical protein
MSKEVVFTIFILKIQQIVFDWDLEGTTEFIEYIEKECGKWAKNFSKKLLKNKNLDYNMIQFGFEEYQEEKGDPFIFDIIINDKITTTKYTRINGINYMKMQDFVEDLIITLDNRAKNSKHYFNIIGKTYKEVTEYNKKYKANFNLDELKNFEQQTRDHFEKYILEKINNEKVKKIINLEIIGKISNIINQRGVEKDIQDILDGQEPTKDDKKQMTKFVRLYEDWNDQILANVTLQLTGKREKSLTLKKYIKTVKRTNNVININWDNLTDVYKIYLLNECNTRGDREIELFKVNETCKAILNCRTKNVRSQKKCIKNPELIEEVNILSK